VSYALLAWQECALKAHCPLAFWTAVLNQHTGPYPRRGYVEAAKRAGLAVYRPCVNHSLPGWTQEGRALRAGVGAIRTLTEDSQGRLVEAREKGGAFRSPDDLFNRVPLTPHERGLLVRVGALDFAGRSRALLLREHGLTAHGRLSARQREEVEP